VRNKSVVNKAKLPNGYSAKEATQRVHWQLNGYRSFRSSGSIKSCLNLGLLHDRRLPFGRDPCSYQDYSRQPFYSLTLAVPITLSIGISTGGMVVIRDDSSVDRLSSLGKVDEGKQN
jgi:hypothetical protein